MLSNNKSIDTLLDHVVKCKKGAAFYNYSNTDGKQWIMPRKHLNTAMNLYQPSCIKGKLFRLFFPYLHWCNHIKNKLSVVEQNYELTDKLKKRLSEIFKIHDIEFAIFGGTPSIHQKIIIQISLKNKILGYCKITDQHEIKQIFKKEQKTLTQLNRKGIGNIPSCLTRESLTETVDIFVQDTTKTSQSRIVHKWSERHWRFLQELNILTRKRQIFELTAFSQTLDKLESLLDKNPLPNVEVIRRTIKFVRNMYQRKEVEFSVFHSDFTPWNMFFEKGELFVFDWEYAGQTFPPFLDWFHFFTQTLLFKKHLSAKQIAARFQREKKALYLYFANPGLSYQCYLLAIICLYLSRCPACVDEQTNKKLSFWIELLSYIRNEYS